MSRLSEISAVEILSEQGINREVSARASIGGDRSDRSIPRTVQRGLSRRSSGPRANQISMSESPHLAAAILRVMHWIAWPALCDLEILIVRKLALGPGGLLCIPIARIQQQAKQHAHPTVPGLQPSPWCSSIDYRFRQFQPYAPIDGLKRPL